MDGFATPWQRRGNPRNAPALNPALSSTTTAANPSTPPGASWQAAAQYFASLSLLFLFFVWLNHPFSTFGGSYMGQSDWGGQSLSPADDWIVARRHGGGGGGLGSGKKKLIRGEKNGGLVSYLSSKPRGAWKGERCWNEEGNSGCVYVCVCVFVRSCVPYFTQLLHHF